MSKLGKKLLNYWASSAVKVDSYSIRHRIILSKEKEDEDHFSGQKVWPDGSYSNATPTKAFFDMIWSLRTLGQLLELFHTDSIILDVTLSDKV